MFSWNSGVHAGREIYVRTDNLRTGIRISKEGRGERKGHKPELNRSFTIESLKDIPVIGVVHLNHTVIDTYKEGSVNLYVTYFCSTGSPSNMNSKHRLGRCARCSPVGGSFDGRRRYECE